LFPAVDPSGTLIPGSDIQAQIASLQGHYNGMGLKVDKRVGAVNLVSSYTYSHKLDNWAASGLSYGNNGRPSYPDYNKIIRATAISMCGIAGPRASCFRRRSVTAKNISPE